MPHDQPRQLRRESDERLRQDREETDRSLMAERASANDLLKELEAALRGAHLMGEPSAGETVELDHGIEPWQEEKVRHRVRESPGTAQRSHHARPSPPGSDSTDSRVRTLRDRIRRERARTDRGIREERAQVERLLTHAMVLASTDSLTDLVNARVFTEVLTAQSERCRAGEQSFGVMYVDLDNFKRVNDLYGHVAGDLLLRKISNLIRRNVRREDIAARLGGDEFGILVSGLPRARIEAIAVRVIESIRALNVTYPDTSLGASLGLLYMDCSGAPHLSAEELLRRADAAMYEAKASGRTTVTITLPEDG